MAKRRSVKPYRFSLLLHLLCLMLPLLFVNVSADIRFDFIFSASSSTNETSAAANGTNNDDGGCVTDQDCPGEDNTCGSRGYCMIVTYTYIDDTTSTNSSGGADTVSNNTSVITATSTQEGQEEQEQEDATAEGETGEAHLEAEMEKMEEEARAATEEPTTSEQEAEETTSDTEGATRNKFKSGCLVNNMPGWTRKRICNSEDPPDAAELGLCRVSEMDYMEIRIQSQNWESVFFATWIAQIVLSEVLEVPTSVETGTPDAKVSFYDPDNSFQYGIGNNWTFVQNANAYGADCTQAPKEEDDYVPCAHFIPEVWMGHIHSLQEMISDNVIEPLQGLGALGEQPWYVPRFTGQRDPTLLTYFGLMGPENQKRIADRFLRPTKWGDYCAQVSPDNCTTPDNTTQRAPQDEAEYNQYFSRGLYHGHFRKTEENDCETYPETCTGHFADYPCGWSSFFEQQAYHLDISLASSGDEPGARGYTYGQLVEIVHASNWTKSDLILNWWYPEALYQTFLGTDMEFTAVSLPPPTQDCVDARVPAVDRCSEFKEERVGDPEGMCDMEPSPLNKVIVKGLYELLHDPNTPEGIQSPAYEVLTLFRMNSLQVGKMIDMWIKGGPDGEGLDPRTAVCQWVVDNFDVVKKYVPRTHPRVLNDSVETDNGLMYAALVTSSLMVLVVASTLSLVFKQRQRRVMVAAQVEFLYLILAGLLSNAIAALLLALPSPTMGSCVSAIWFNNVGYTLMVTPLLVKVSAINSIMNAAKRFRRVKVNRSDLLRNVFIILFFVLLFLICWTAIDAPDKKAEYHLTDKEDSEGNTIVEVNYYCSSDQTFWQYISISWNAILLFCATVLAIQSRKVRQEFNESQTLAIMIYSHSAWLLFRIVISLFLPGVANATVLTRCKSLIFSADTLATVAIYFIPKFFASDRPIYDPRASFMHSLEPRGSLPNSTHASSNFAASFRNSSHFTADSRSDEDHGDHSDPSDNQDDNGENKKEVQPPKRRSGMHHQKTKHREEHHLHNTCPTCGNEVDLEEKHLLDDYEGETGDGKV